MEPIEIMPRTVGSGPEGTAELLSLAKPVLAIAALSPIGRGIAGAVATMASIPEESEAGVFKMLRTKATTNALVEGGVSVFPDLSRNFEFSTNSFAGYLAKGGKLPNIGKETGMFNTLGLRIKDTEQVIDAYSKLKSIPIASATDKAMVSKHGVSSSTSGFFSNTGRRGDKGNIVVKDSLPVFDKAAVTTHELTHALDIDDPITRSIMWSKDKGLDYAENLSESRAFIAGNRHMMDDTLTDPGSVDFLHPMLGYANGVVSTAPGLDFINNMKRSYKSVGQEVDQVQINDYMRLLVDEKLRIQDRVNVNQKFRNKLDEATIATNRTNAQWNLNSVQGRALESAQLGLVKTKDRESLGRMEALEYDNIMNNLKEIKTKREQLPTGSVSDSDILN